MRLLRTLPALLLALLILPTPAAAQLTSEVDATKVYLWSGGTSRLNISTGSGAPSGGVTSDFYIDYATGEVYTKRASGTWTVIPRFEDTNTFTALQTFNAGLTVSAGTVTFAGGLTAGSGTVGIINGAGKIPALTSTYFASVAFDAANLTGTIASGVQDNITRTGALTSGSISSGFGAIDVGADGITGGAFSGTTGSFSSTLHAGGNFDVASSKFTVAAASGNTVVAGTLGVTGTATFTANVNPATNYTSNIGSLSTKFLQLHAAELVVETLVAQNTAATIGGRILVAPTNTLTADLSNVATTITVKYNNLANGDRIYLEENGNVEWMAVTSAAGGSAGVYTYTVTRNLDGSGANTWAAGAAAVDTGTTGNGLIDIYSTGGVLTGTGPTIVGNVRTGTTYSNLAARWAAGNLKGLYGYVADTYGFAAGDSTAANITIDATNGLRIRNGTTNQLVADASGNLSLSSGNATIDSSGVHIAVSSSGVYTAAAAYDFTVATGDLGVSAYNDSGASQRSLLLRSTWTGAGSYTSSISMRAAGVSGGTNNTADLQLQSNGTTGTIAVVGTTATWLGDTLTFSGMSAPTIIKTAGEFRVDAGTLVTTIQAGFVGTSTGDLQILAGNATKIKCFSGGGCTMGTPTGGDKGAGTLNATAVYDDNVLLTDWVFWQFFGVADAAPGPKKPKRLYTMAEVRDITEREHRLPWMPKADEFETERHVGGMLTRIWQGQEQQQLYLFDLEARIAALEKKGGQQ